MLDDHLTTANLRRFMQALWEYELIRGSMGSAIDIDHSSLFQRRLYKQPLYKYAPPTAMSYPWYDLLDKGKDVRCSVHVPEGEFSWFTHGKPINVNQSYWVLDEVVEPGKIYVASWPRYKLKIRLEKQGENDFCDFMATVIETENVPVDDLGDIVRLPK